MTLLLIDIVLEDQHLHTHFQLDDQGWLFRHDSDGIWRRVCWLPYKRRHKGEMANLGQRVCIGASSGVVTILDFSDVSFPPISDVYIAS
jgi:hypothetical protein